MVQCMEAWFLADKDALRRYYGTGFNRSALPGSLRIEEIPKADIFRGLERAAAATTKETYHKTHHGFDILSSLDPSLVQKQSRFADELFIVLLANLT